jgi:hypothetical protein
MVVPTILQSGQGKGAGYARLRAWREMARKEKSGEKEVYDSAGVVRLENECQTKLWYEEADDYWKVWLLFLGCYF